MIAGLTQTMRNGSRQDIGRLLHASEVARVVDQFHAWHALPELRLREFAAHPVHFGMEPQRTIERAQYLPPALLVAMSHSHMGLVFSTITIPRG
jgi:hypothetical protein